MAAETSRTPTAAQLYEVRRDLTRVIEGLVDAIRWAPRSR